MDVEHSVSIRIEDCAPIRVDGCVPINVDEGSANAYVRFDRKAEASANVGGARSTDSRKWRRSARGSPCQRLQERSE